jgi:ribosome-associated translation inhibitor RaiA
MLVQLNTDNHVLGHADLARYVENAVQGALGRFEPQLTRVEVQLTDQNSHKDGQSDKRCLLEARLAGLQPIAVSQDGDSIDQALDGAIEKLAQTLDRRLSRLADRGDRVSMAGDPDANQGLVDSDGAAP